MPEFDTPEPITVEIDLVVGDVRLTASERANTVVEVRPSDPADEHRTSAPPSRPGSSAPPPGCWSGHRGQRNLGLIGPTAGPARST